MSVKKTLSTSSILCDLSRASLAALMFSVFGSPALANPEDGTVSAGSASISTTGKKLDIYQTTDKVVIDWRRFNIGADEATEFHQPSSASIAVNRIRDNNPSQIFGKLIANGNIIIINPNGVMFGHGSKIDVNGLVATTSDIKNENFMSGKMVFDKPGNPNASIINEGEITAKDAGLVGLVAPNVSNSGTIHAHLGKVQLASADEYTLDMYGDGLMEIKVSDDVKSQLVSNTGKIDAAGGTIQLSAAAGREMVNSLITVKGELKAPSIEQRNGKIIISASGSNKTRKSGSSKVVVDADIDASGANVGEKGGMVDIFGDNIDVKGGNINVSGHAGGGKVRIGGDFHGEGLVATALTTIIGSTASIDASAKHNGKGGSVVVWSDGETDFSGSIKAKGGEQGGDGGAVETSGHILHALGTVDASSPHGVGGEWLLDPYNVTIAAGAGTDVAAGCTGTPQTCTPTADATIYVNNLNATLTAGTSVTITTGGSSPGASTGDITVNGAINESYAGIVGLTLSAYRNITVSQAISSGSGKLNLKLISNNANNSSGYINVAGAITTLGGDITMGGSSGTVGGATVDPTAGTIFGTAATGFAVGNGSSQAGGILINGVTVNAGGGNIIMNGIGQANAGTAIGITLSSATVKTSGTGTINATGTGGSTGAGSGNRGIYLSNTSVIETASGALNLTGTGGATSGGNEYGVGLSSSNANSIRATGTGNINIYGSSLATGGTTNHGVYVGQTTSSITSQGGNVDIRGYGATGNAAASNYGVYADGNISTNLTGTLNLVGVGGGNTNSGTNYGVYILNGAAVSTATGALTVTGTGGGAGTGTNNYGVYVTGASSTIKSTGTGADVTVTGIRGGGAVASNYGLNLNVANAVQTTGTGNINLITDTIILNAANNANSIGNLIIKPYTVGTQFSVGSATNGLQLSDTYLGYLNWSSSGYLKLGDGTNTGAMDINTALIHTKPIIFQTKSGSNITLSGQLKSSSTGTPFTLASGGNFVNSVGSTAFNLSGTGSPNWLVYSTNPASDTINSLTSNYRRFTCAYGGSCPTLGTGNGFLYSYTPTLTITPSAASATYGSAASLSGYSYSTSGYLSSDSGSDSVTGSLTGTSTYATGSNIGTYNINYSSGTLASTMGYGFTYANNATALTVGTRAITVTPNNSQTKVYGASDPTLTYALSSGSLYGSDALTGALSRAAGSNVGSYSISQGTLAASSNYAVTFTAGRTFAITAAPLTVTAATKTKTYGGSDPALTYTYSSLTNSDTSSVFTGALSRTAGENVGSYAINQNTLSAGSNYTVTYVSANLGITAAPLTITAAAKTKVYGGSDPALTYTYSSLTNSDTSSVFTGALSRTAGENVGSYAINQNTLSAGSNYSVTYVSANLGITAAPLTITAAAKTKVYGGSDPALTYTYGSLANSDTSSIFTGALSRTAGENVGNYAINQNTLSAGSNYTVTYVSANLGITAAPVTVTAAAKTKVYGGSDPALTYTYGSLANGDTSSVFTGALSRTAGENVGSYAINQNTLSAGSNYTVTYVSANLGITAAPLTVTAAAKTKTYGGSDPALTYTYSSLANSDTSSVFTGALSRTAGENVGSYAINQNTLSAGSNYSVTYVSANLGITAAPLTVTAATKTKTYGAADPTLTYTYSSLANSDTSSIFTGALSRTAGENVGSYAINQNTLSAGSNYTVTYVSANLGITAAPLTVTAAAKSKTYGAADPALTYTYSALANSDTSSVFSGSLSRTAGENAGTYAINQGTVSAGSNYTISYVSNNLTINPYTLTVTAAAKSKTYGGSDPALTYTYGTLQNSDTSSVFSGALSRAAGENAGTYAINQGTVSAGSNYTISYASNNLIINPYTLTVTAAAKSKTYGASDPSLTYTYGTLQNSDTSSVFSGSLSRTAGENAGTYAISQGTVSAGSNYTISYTGANLTVNPYTLTVTAAAKSKTYGVSDPSLTYTYGTLQNSDTSSVFTGALSRTAGENAGTYAINQGTVSAGSNYTISYASNNLTINPYTLTVTAAAKSKTYGGSDPALTYTYGTLQNSDTGSVFSGSLSRAAGENVGSYAINQGTVSAGGNYTISYVSNNLTVNAAPLTVTAAAKTKVYGGSDPSLTYTYGSLANGDTSSVFSGALSRTAGENVGSYAINQNTLSAGSNYTVTYVSANLGITAAPLTITAAAKTKVYGGSDPALTYTYSSLTNSDTSSVFTGALSRTAGENVGSYAINQNTLSAGSNYSVTYVSANLGITAAPLTITAAAKTKVYGDTDPTLTYTYSSLANSDTSSVFTGALSRTAGENVGNYAINQGTVSAGSNYTISYVSNSLTVNAAPLTVTAAAKTKVYGGSDPALTYTYSSLANSDTSSIFTGALSRTAGENVGSYAINQNTLSAGSNYTVTYVSANLGITAAPLTVTAAAKSKTYGASDPALTYTYSALANSDTASVFSGSLSRTAGENAGTYAINQNTVTAGSNYTITYAGNNLTIDPASLTVTATAKSKTYGGSDPALTYTYGALFNGDTSSVFSGALSRIAGENAGTYAINQNTLSAGSNYSVTYVSANLGITAAPLTITAAAKSKTYGGSDPALTYSYSSLVNGDTSSVLSGSLSRTAGENAGTYAINQNTVTAGGNYAITYVGSNLTIDPASLTVSASTKSKTYGGVDPALTYTYSGLTNGDVTASFTGALSRAAGENATSYAIGQNTLASTGNYTISTFNAGTFTIDPAALTITAAAKTKVYGAADPALTYTYGGLVNSDTSAVFSGALSRAGGSNAGSYAINQGTLSGGGNYSITYNSANLDITAAALTITASDKTKIYGDSNPSLTLAFTGLVNGDSSSVFSGYSLGTAADTASNIGSYAISLSGGTAGNYTITRNNGTLSVTPAPLTIRADNKIKIFDDINPLYTVTYTGFKNSDNAGSLSGLSVSSAAVTHSPIGDYAIIAAGATSSNYNITFVDGILNINLIGYVPPVVIPPSVSRVSQAPQITFYNNPITNPIMSISTNNGVPIIINNTAYNDSGPDNIGTNIGSPAYEGFFNPEDSDSMNPGSGFYIQRPFEDLFTTYESENQKVLYGLLELSPSLVAILNNKSL